MSLFKESIQDHLTASPADPMARASFPGMAHFAGTGPAGKTCRECIFWKHAPHDYRSKNGGYGGKIKPAECAKYRQLSGDKGRAVPDNARSCRHYEENQNPPPRFQKA